MRHRLAAIAIALHGVAGTASAFMHGPYKDVTLGPSIAPANGAVMTLAFATGECGRERWLGIGSQRVVREHIAAMVEAGIDYVVSTGGATGVFSCAGDAGMERFIRRHASPRLVGIDFDIEHGQTPAQIDALVRRVQRVQQRHPMLRLSFTLASFAGTDERRASLNPLGERVLAALRRHRVEGVVINLMAMNYGPASPRVCVVAEGRCDMHASALQAARNLHERHGIPLARIALTAMLGVNDVAENVFTPDDARRLARDARAMGLAGLHYWSQDRDRSCPADDQRLSPRCHSLPGLQPGDFARAFEPAQ